jgi:hypothetical protein
MRKTIITIIVLSLFATISFADISWPRFFDKLWQKETGKRLNPPAGDHGASQGPLQIKYEYWKDSSIKHGSYSDCRKLPYAKQVVKSYMLKHAKRAVKRGDIKTLARIHNGGPKGYLKKSTIKYARSF